MLKSLNEWVVCLRTAIHERNMLKQVESLKGIFLTICGLIEKSGPLDEAVALIGAVRPNRQRHHPAEHRCRLRPAGHRVFCANRAVGL